MRIFECQNCSQPLYFENTGCESCGLKLGYLPEQATMTALKEGDGRWLALAEPEGRYRHCNNALHEACNWLVPDDQPGQFCVACRHNRTIPDLSVPENLQHWRKIEVAKRRLFYTLLKFKLPLATKDEEPDALAFDFVADQNGPQGHIPVLTGHEDGLITINIAEADDPERERRRNQMGEPYRTLLGHFRHEIAHYYWDRLVAQSASLEEFRAVFGDEQQDYGQALQQHYANGPPPDWPERFVSSYASSHPWEDFAETWAHYLHMIDTLETASAFGLSMRPKVGSGEMAAKLDFDPHGAEMTRIIDAWLPLTYAMNSINRSMGHPDLYPFVLKPPVIDKLTFIHRLTHPKAGASVQETAREALRAIAASLRRNIGLPAA